MTHKHPLRLQRNIGFVWCASPTQDTQPVSPSVRFLPLGFALGHVCSIMLCLEDEKSGEPAGVDRKTVHSTVYQILEVLSLGGLFEISSININIAKWLLHSQFPYLLISSLTFSLPGIYDFFKPTPPSPFISFCPPNLKLLKKSPLPNLQVFEELSQMCPFRMQPLDIALGIGLDFFWGDNWMVVLGQEERYLIGEISEVFKLPYAPNPKWSNSNLPTWPWQHLFTMLECSNSMICFHQFPTNHGTPPSVPGCQPVQPELHASPKNIGPWMVTVALWFLGRECTD